MAINITEDMTEKEKALYFKNFAPLRNESAWSWGDMINGGGGNAGNSQVNQWDAFNTNALQEFNNQNSVNSFDESQLQGLINQESNYQNKANEARDIRTAAANSPSQPFVPSMDNWDWAYGGKGIPEVEIMPFNSTEEDTSGGLSSSYDLGYGLTPESSNMDIMNIVMGLDKFDNPQDQEKFTNWMATTGEGNPSNMFDWANIDNPESYTLGLSDSELGSDNKIWFNKILNSIYTDNNQGKPLAAPGYANPNPADGYANPINSTGVK